MLLIKVYESVTSTTILFKPNKSQVESFRLRTLILNCWNKFCLCVLLFPKYCSVAWYRYIYIYTYILFVFGQLSTVSGLAKRVVYYIHYIKNQLHIIFCGSQDDFFNSTSVWTVDKNGDFRVFGLCIEEWNSAVFTQV